MKSIKNFTAISGAIVCAAGVMQAAPASAQAARTWISGVGDDLNPCSRTAPCKTFAGAISKTAPGGEINCLDPNGAGAVTITKSITIDCRSTVGSALNTGSNGIVVNDSASGFPNSIHVILRGLSINGSQTGAQNAAGNPGSGNSGIVFTSGASLVVEDVIIQNQNAGTAVGIRFQPAGAAQLSVANTVITDNGIAGTGGGILIQPTGANGTARVVLNNVRVTNNLNNGLFVNTTGATNANGITVRVINSQFTNNTNGISVLQPAATQNVAMMISGTDMSNNTGTGLTAAGAGTILRVDGSSISGNATGVSTSSGAQILSYGTNLLDGNPTVGAANNGTFTGVPIPRK